MKKGLLYFAKPNQTKRNETKPNETERNETRFQTQFYINDSYHFLFTDM